jgi:hypothetical protein
MIARLLSVALMLIAVDGACAAPVHIEQHLGQARSAGKGTFTWFGLRIYDAQLWVGDRGYQPDAPFALELRYARKLDGRKIAEASASEMAKLSVGSAAQRAAWLARMTAIFPDVKEGTRISGVFVPGGGIRFYLDDEPLAAVPDQVFARAFFAIWLDPGTSARGLRAALLQDAGPR